MYIKKYFIDKYGRHIEVRVYTLKAFKNRKNETKTTTNN